MNRETNLQAIEREIESLGYGTEEYFEATAFLLTIMAKRQWILADQARRSRLARERREARRGRVADG